MLPERETFCENCFLSNMSLKLNGCFPVTNNKLLSSVKKGKILSARTTAHGNGLTTAHGNGLFRFMQNEGFGKYVILYFVSSQERHDVTKCCQGYMLQDASFMHHVACDKCLPPEYAL